MNDYIDKGEVSRFDDGQEELFDLNPEPEEFDEIDKAYRRVELQIIVRDLRAERNNSDALVSSIQSQILNALTEKASGGNQYSL
jgi:hypothetical protein